jgi:hypothetical protein
LWFSKRNVYGDMRGCEFLDFGGGACRRRVECVMHAILILLI